MQQRAQRGKATPAYAGRVRVGPRIANQLVEHSAILQACAKHLLRKVLERFEVLEVFDVLETFEVAQGAAVRGNRAVIVAGGAEKLSVHDTGTENTRSNSRRSES